MTLQTPVYVSTSPDDGQGDKLRDAFIKINERFKDVETAQAAGISEIYQGARAVDPTVRGDLTPLQEGDFYFNTTLATPAFKVYIDGAWVVAPDITAAALAAATGSSLVGFIQAGTGAVPRTGQDKMRETVSVKDFGAVGDGLTNNGTAFSDALAYLGSVGGGTLYVPYGDYPVAISITTSNIRLLCDPGTVLRASGSSQVIRITNTAENVEIIGPRILGQTIANESVLPPTNNTNALFGIRVDGKRVTLRNVYARGFRQDSLYVRVSGKADLNCFDCVFDQTARNTVSIVDGTHINYYRCKFISGNDYQSAFGNQLYLFDAEPASPEVYSNLTFEDCQFLSDTTSVGGGEVILSDPYVANNDVQTNFLRCSFTRTDVSKASCRIRPRFEARGISIRDCTFHDRVFVQAGSETFNVYDSLFENIVLGNVSFAFATTINNGCSLKNITSTAVGGLTTITGATTNQVSLVNVQGFSDRSARPFVSNGSVSVSGGDLSVIGSTGTLSKVIVGDASVDGGSVVHVAKRLAVLHGTTGQVLLTISGVNTTRVAQVWEVTVNTQASGSTQGRRQRSQKIAFMVTAGGSLTPVVDLITGYGWAEVLSTAPGGGDRDPGAMSLAVSVVSNEVVVTADVTNTTSSGSNTLNVFAVGTGRRIALANVN